MRIKPTTAQAGALALRTATPFAIMGLCIWVLAQRVDLGTANELPRMLRSVPPLNVSVAIALCALSFWAIARYDSVAHRHFETGISDPHARQSGFAAIAIAQTVGFGLLTSAAVRWRMLAGLTLTRAAQLSAFVAVTFLLALLVLTALAMLVLPSPDWLFWPSVGVVIITPLALFYLSFAPRTRKLMARQIVPNLIASAAILCWVALDVIAAALAFYLLVPAVDLQFAVFLPAFMLAFGAGLLSGAPGGVGPFELTLMALLPHIPPAELIAGIVAFRLFYYACPAIIGGLMLLRQPFAARHSPARARMRRPFTAEQGVLLQNGGQLVEHSHGAYAVWQTPQTTTMLFDPAAGTPGASLSRLFRQARKHNRVPLLYKVSARTALAARLRGWQVTRTAQDAIVNLRIFDLSSPESRGLRRKLRKAQGAGVVVGRASQLPLVELARVDAEWQNAHGIARGGTMGRFCPAYLARQEVFVAYQSGRLIAFASFHHDAASLTLDLMRHQTDVPDGTMHALVNKALDFADAQGKAIVSLAALPDLPAWLSRLPFFRNYAENAGLRQFKSTFATSLRPLYAAAPDPVSLAIGLADITVEVHVPAPLRLDAPAHNQDEQYEFALHAQS